MAPGTVARKTVGLMRYGQRLYSTNWVQQNELMDEVQERKESGMTKILGLNKSKAGFGAA